MSKDLLQHSSLFNYDGSCAWNCIILISPDTMDIADVVLFFYLNRMLLLTDTDSVCNRFLVFSGVNNDWQQKKSI